MSDLRYLFVDMNAYFASVEQQLESRLRGRPVGVVPVMTDSTCCIAASYEARAFGVRTGTGVREAKRLCPQIELALARPDVYVEYHHKIKAAVETCLPIERVESIDEMFGRLLGEERAPARATEIARAVQAAIHEIGEALHCSIGIGPNVWLAKIGSSMKEADGLTLIRRSDLPGALHGLKLTDLTGIAQRTATRFYRHGVKNVEQLCSLSETKMAEVFGSRALGAKWHAQLRGEDLPYRGEVRRTVGHSHVLGPERRSDAGARAVLVRMIHKAAFRLRELGYHTRRIDVSVNHEDGSRWHDGRELPYVRDTLTLLRAFGELWPGRVRGHGIVTAPKKVSVVLSRLCPDAQAPAPLFAPQANLAKLSGALDTADRHYGWHTLYFGSMFGATGSAPTRISFNRIPKDTQFENRKGTKALNPSPPDKPASAGANPTTTNN